MTNSYSEDNNNISPKSNIYYTNDANINNNDNTENLIENSIPIQDINNTENNFVENEYEYTNDDNNTYTEIENFNYNNNDILNDKVIHESQNDLTSLQENLLKIDNQNFSWHHIKTILIAGVGFLTDAYDIFAINLSITIINHVYYNSNISSSTETLLKVSTSVGTIIGQLFFGRLGDVLGRKAVYGKELILIIVCTILQATIAESPAINFTALLTFYRIVMGIGIGGDYPLSSIISSEFSTTKWRGAIMAAVFANQAWGQIFAGIVAMILVRGYRNELNSTQCDTHCIKACDQMWRVLVGMGAVPGVIALYYRLTIPESPRYKLKQLEQETQIIYSSNSTIGNEEMNINDDMKKQDIATTSLKSINPTPPSSTTNSNDHSFKDFYDHFKQWRYGKILLGTAASWFMLDVAFYGLALNSAVILQTIGFASSKNIYSNLYNSAAGNLILICAGSLPGYWFSVFTIDIIGRKPIQLFGFIILTVLFCVIGFAYNRLSDGGLLGLYIVAQFFVNFGPNTTTFIIPGEVFPTRYRSTAHGISAASGKLGAIIAQTALGTLINHGCEAKGAPKNCWLPHVMEIFALFMLLGIFSTLLIPETKRMTLEEISMKYHDCE